MPICKPTYSLHQLMRWSEKAREAASERPRGEPTAGEGEGEGKVALASDGARERQQGKATERGEQVSDLSNGLSRPTEARRPERVRARDNNLQPTTSKAGEGQGGGRRALERERV